MLRNHVQNTINEIENRYRGHPYAFRAHDDVEGGITLYSRVHTLPNAAIDTPNRNVLVSGPFFIAGSINNLNVTTADNIRNNNIVSAGMAVNTDPKTPKLHALVDTAYRLRDNFANQVAEKTRYSTSVLEDLDTQITSKTSANQELQTRINNLNTQLESSKIDNFVGALNPSQKAHILSKIWHSDNPDHQNLKNIVMEQGFDANYVGNSGSTSLLKIALDNSDEALLEHLVENNLNLLGKFDNNIVFGAILQQQNLSSIHAKILMNENLGDLVQKSLFGLVKLGKTDEINAAFALKPELALSKQYGLTLLQFSLKLEQGAISEFIYQAKPESIYQTNNAGLDAVELALNTKNNNALDWIKNHGVDFTAHLQTSIDEHNVDKIKLILEVNKDLDLSSMKDSNGNTILHIAAQGNDVDLINICNERCPELLTQKNNNQQTPCEFASSEGISDFDILSKLIIENTSEHNITHDDDNAADVNSITDGMGLLGFSAPQEDYGNS